MDEKIISVDVEQIMGEIRRRIAERGDTDKILSFDEAIADREIGEDYSFDTVPYSEAETHKYIQLASGEHNIPYYEPIEGNKIKVFIKRLIRKMMAFQMLTIRNRQNQYNYYTIQSIRYLEAQVIHLKDVLIEKEGEIEQLETRIDALERNNRKE